MLLFIVNLTMPYQSRFFPGFNTSHVTLYHKSEQQVDRICLVSIHLMLLFIPVSTGCQPYGNLFQYISCYSLSKGKPEYSWNSNVSIHLMLLFIPRFIGFSSSNSFYNTAKYKGLQDFYQPIYHFLFTQQNLI